ncbi:MAG: histidine--tRNA ligase [bacterium]|nr:histidine--tRNA ligase [bacterium]
MTNMKFQPVKGTRDFYPEQMAFRNWLFGKMREVSQRFGYQEYDGPILEPLELYAAKSGEELISKQTFILTDRGDRKLALRPEMTPTLARMVAQKQNEYPKPIKWFNIGPRFRYEQPQKGRGREFYQWDIDLIGINTPEADAEILSTAAAVLNSVGLSPEEVKIKVNDRQLIEKKLAFIEIKDEQKNEVFRAIDRRNKLDPTEWESWLSEIGLNSLQINDLKGILADKDFAEESETLTRIFSTLDDLGLKDYVEFDPNIVRGLEYYTGVVFEAFDTGGKFRAILGGGRYDNLVEIVGGQPLPAIGFAMGDQVVEEVLKEYGKWPQITISPTKVLITLFNESLVRDSLKLAQSLRKEGINTEIYPETVKLEKQLKYAAAKGIPFVIILGPEELANNKVVLKDMKSGEQKEVPKDQLPDEFKTE